MLRRRTGAEARPPKRRLAPDLPRPQEPVRLPPRPRAPHTGRQWLTVTAAGWKIINAPPPPIKFVIREIEAPQIAPSLAPSGLKEFRDERHEMQQAHASYKPKKRRSAHGSMDLETNMAAFEHEDPQNNRPPSSNMGYSSIKSMFRR